jgi:flavin reductase (DIM6/NTAB) family NADH-FMN oxidoreductase RutF
MLVLAWLECAMAQIVSFSMSGTRHGQNLPFQHGWNTS